MAEKEKPTAAPKPERPETVETTVCEIRRATRKKYSAEDAKRIRIVLEGLRSETEVRELCRREGTPRAFSVYYTWSKEFLEAGSSAWSVTLPGRPAAGR